MIYDERPGASEVLPFTSSSLNVQQEQLSWDLSVDIRSPPLDSYPDAYVNFFPVTLLTLVKNLRSISISDAASILLPSGFYLNEAGEKK
ncbi:hypothetical protein EVAR_26475_1 [Eumeta japonica]|uniref:Uncharacterized protein n=1 Tax=Eumeta variegata TaxID=151549 RepID=A0A4C1V8P2_EUMVA|nr:hypothetical protein EVAR_26475_1 [Eumeta japonica]